MYECRCGKFFSRISNYRRHQLIHDNLRPPYKCPVQECDQTYKWQCLLNVHIRGHTGDRPHACPVSGCLARFRTRAILIRHQISHSSEKKYLCPVQGCGRRLKYNHNLPRHIQNHSKYPKRIDHDIADKHLAIATHKSQITQRSKRAGNISARATLTQALERSNVTEATTEATVAGTLTRTVVAEAPHMPTTNYKKEPYSTLAGARVGKPATASFEPQSLAADNTDKYILPATPLASPLNLTSDYADNSSVTSTVEEMSSFDYTETSSSATISPFGAISTDYMETSAAPTMANIAVRRTTETVPPLALALDYPRSASPTANTVIEVMSTSSTTLPFPGSVPLDHLEISTSSRKLMTPTAGSHALATCHSITCLETSTMEARASLTQIVTPDVQDISSSEVYNLQSLQSEVRTPIKQDPLSEKNTMSAVHGNYSMSSQPAHTDISFLKYTKHHGEIDVNFPGIMRQDEYPCSKSWCPMTFSSQEDQARHVLLHTQLRSSFRHLHGRRHRRARGPTRSHKIEDTIGVHLQKTGLDDQGGKETSEHLFKCVHQNCHRSYITRLGLKQHVARSHKNNLIYECRCGKFFSRISNYRRHQLIHDNLRAPYECPVQECDQTYKWQCLLNVHIRGHTGDRPHACPVSGCLARFRTRAILIRHQVSHSSEKKYLCPVQGCGRRLKYNHNLPRHIQNHSKYPKRIDHDIADKHLAIATHKSQITQRSKRAGNISARATLTQALERSNVKEATTEATAAGTLTRTVVAEAPHMPTTNYKKEPYSTLTGARVGKTATASIEPQSLAADNTDTYILLSTPLASPLNLASDYADNSSVTSTVEEMSSFDYIETSSSATISPFGTISTDYMETSAAATKANIAVRRTTATVPPLALALDYPGSSSPTANTVIEVMSTSSTTLPFPGSEPLDHLEISTSSRKLMTPTAGSHALATCHSITCLETSTMEARASLTQIVTPDVQDISSSEDNLQSLQSEVRTPIKQDPLSEKNTMSAVHGNYSMSSQPAHTDISFLKYTKHHGEIDVNFPGIMRQDEYPCSKSWCPMTFSSQEDQARHVLLHTQLRSSFRHLHGRRHRRARGPTRSHKIEDTIGVHLQKTGLDDQGGKETSEHLFKCVHQNCNRNYITRLGLKQHVARSHKNNLIYECRCGKFFSRISNYRRHQLIHDNLRAPYECPVQECDQTYKWQCLLNVHIRGHTGDRPHACPVSGCLARFRTRAILIRHQISHSSEKKYLCALQGCGRRLKYNHNLPRHIQNHSKYPRRIDHDIADKHLAIATHKSQITQRSKRAGNISARTTLTQALERSNVIEATSTEATVTGTLTRTIVSEAPQMPTTNYKKEPYPTLTGARVWKTATASIEPQALAADNTDKYILVATPLASPLNLTSDYADNSSVTSTVDEMSSFDYIETSSSATISPFGSISTDYMETSAAPTKANIAVRRTTETVPPLALALDYPRTTSPTANTVIEVMSTSSTAVPFPDSLPLDHLEISTSSRKLMTPTAGSHALATCHPITCLETSTMEARTTLTQIVTPDVQDISSSDDNVQSLQSEMRTPIKQDPLSEKDTMSAVNGNYSMSSQPAHTDISFIKYTKHHGEIDVNFPDIMRQDEYPCSKSWCPRTFSSQEDQARHVLLHTQLKSSFRHLHGRRHRRASDPTRSHKIEDTIGVHLQKTGLDDQGGKETSEHLFKCVHQNCNRNYITRLGLKQHVARSHKNNLIYECRCGKFFSRISRYRRHQLIHDNLHPPYKCPVQDCDQTYKWQCLLNVHVRGHTGDRHHACPVSGCLARFRTRAILIRHQTSHLSENKYLCPVQGCGRRLKYKRNVPRHIRNHSKCPKRTNHDIADKRFATITKQKSPERRIIVDHKISDQISTSAGSSDQYSTMTLLQSMLNRSMKTGKKLSKRQSKRTRKLPSTHTMNTRKKQSLYKRALTGENRKLHRQVMRTKKTSSRAIKHQHQSGATRSSYNLMCLDSENDKATYLGDSSHETTEDGGTSDSVDNDDDDDSSWILGTQSSCSQSSSLWDSDDCSSSSSIIVRRRVTRGNHLVVREDSDATVDHLDTAEEQADLA